MIKIVCLEQSTIPVLPKEKTKISVPCKWEDYATTDSSAEGINRAADADVLIINKFQITKDFIKNLSKLRLILVFATGVNNVDANACKEQGIAVANLQNYSTESVAEQATTLLLSLARQLPYYSSNTLNGTWYKSNSFCLMNKPISDLAGKNILIIGMGCIGNRVKKIMKCGFNMHVLVSARPGTSNIPEGRVSLTEGLKKADFISIHCPLTEETKNLISYEQIALMKHNVIIINTARGGIIDEDALVKGIKDGKIGGLGLDVLPKEPPVINDPLIALQKNYNVIVTPHTAWIGDTALTEAGKQLIENLNAFFKGEKLRRII